MTSQRYRSGSALAALLLLTIFSCRDLDGPDPDPNPKDPHADVVVAQVVVSPGAVTLEEIGGTQQFQAQAKDASGNTVSGKSFTWASSNPAVATIDGDGLATVRAAGTTTITATTEGVPGTATMTVFEPQPTFTGFDFDLGQGDYWDFYWSYEYNRVVQGSGGSHSSDGGHFRITLGASRSIEGVTAYEIVMSGDYTDNEWDYTPRWKYLAVDGSQILGSTTGQTLEIVFDAKNGTWHGGGFWADQSDEVQMTAVAGSIQNEFIETQAIAIRTSDGQDFCQNVAGHRICPNETEWTLSESEYYKGGIGPVGYHLYFGWSSNGGGFFTSFSHERHIGLVASSLAGAVGVVPTAPAWTEKADMPRARSYHSTAVLNGKIYVIGGQERTEAGTTVLAEMSVYDPGSDTWSTGTPLPEARSHHTSTVSDGKIYVIGGHVDEYANLSANVWEYDPATDTWTSKTDAPGAMGEHSAVAAGGYVFVFPSTSEDVYAYEVATDAWWAATASPVRYGAHAAAIVGNAVFLMGGAYRDWDPWAGYFTNYTSTCLGFDLTEPYGSENAWSYMASMPTARARLAMAVVDERIYAIGGYDAEPSRAVEMYDPTTNTWTEKFPLFLPTQDHAAAVVNGKVYVIGGSGYWDSRASVYEYDPANDW